MSTFETNMSNRQLQAIQTRERLLEAGRVIFLENGFQKATFSQIHKLAKTGYGTAYVYFRNKDDLFLELMDDIIKRLYDVAEISFQPNTHKEAYEMIKSQVQLFLQSALEEKEMMKVVKEAIGVSLSVETKWLDIRKRFIQAISRDIEFVQKAGLAKKELSPTLVAKGWFYANEQLMWDLVTEEMEEDKMEQVIVTLTEMYTSGLYLE